MSPTPDGGTIAPGRAAPRRVAPAVSHCWGVALLVALAGCSTSPPVGSSAASPSEVEPAEVVFAPELGIDLADFDLRSSGLYVQEIEEGEGPVARRTSRVWIHYVGWLPDGTVFDSSLGGEPFHLRLGGNEVIRGWNEGIVGMRRGGERRLVVPPALGYGSRGSTRTPPGATLVFQVRLVDVD